MDYRVYRVDPRGRGPLREFILDALKAAGCSVVHASPADEAPFRISFVTPAGERLGILVYAFTATFTPTKNRPADEHSFQLKYGSKVYGEPAKLRHLWQDPYGLYTTLCCGSIRGRLLCRRRPEMHNPTKFFIRFELNSTMSTKSCARDGTAGSAISGGRATSQSRSSWEGAPRRSSSTSIERMAFREDQGIDSCSPSGSPRRRRAASSLRHPTPRSLARPHLCSTHLPGNSRCQSGRSST